MGYKLVGKPIYCVNGDIAARFKAGSESYKGVIETDEDNTISVRIWKFSFGYNNEKEYVYEEHNLKRKDEATLMLAIRNFAYEVSPEKEADLGDTHKSIKSKARLAKLHSKRLPKH